MELLARASALDTFGSCPADPERRILDWCRTGGGHVIKRLVAALRHALHRGQLRACPTDAMLHRFAAACEDLTDDDVMKAAWR